MKKFFTTLCIFFSTLCVANAQDLMITQSGEVIKAYGIEMAEKAIFYRLVPEDNGDVQRISKSDVLMIKGEDGSITSLVEKSEDKTTKKESVTSAEPTPQPIVDTTPTIDREANDEIAKRINNEIFFIGDADPNDKNLNYFYKYNAVNNCVFEDSNISVVMTNIYINSTYDLYIENKSNQTVHIDLSNSYLITNGQSFIIREKANAIIKSTSGTTGAAVNLGSVAGALGASKGVRNIAGGVTVGGSKTNSTSEIIEDESHIISLPPGVSKFVTSSGSPFANKSLNDTSFNFGFEDTSFNALSSTEAHLYNIKSAGESMEFDQTNSPIKVGSYIVYHLANNIEKTNTIKSDYYLSKVIGINNSTKNLSMGWSQSIFSIKEVNRTKVANNLKTASFIMDMGIDMRDGISDDDLFALNYGIEYSNVRYKHLSGRAPNKISGYIGYGAGLSYALLKTPQVQLKAKWGITLGGTNNSFWTWGILQPYVGFDLSEQTPVVGASLYEWDLIDLKNSMSCTFKLIEYNSLGYMYFGGFKVGYVFGPKGTSNSSFKVKWD